jgi:hypothetical protein
MLDHGINVFFREHCENCNAIDTLIDELINSFIG